MEGPGPGVRLELVATGIHHSPSHAGSFTHGARSGLEPASSWMLVRFVSTEPGQELLKFIFESMQMDYR